jgi:hypothetical protein
LPLLAQPEIASAQISHVFFILCLSISSVLLVLILNMGQRVSGQLFLGARLFLSLQSVAFNPCVDLADFNLGVEFGNMMAGVIATTKDEDDS